MSKVYIPNKSNISFNRQINVLKEVYKNKEDMYKLFNYIYINFNKNEQTILFINLLNKIDIISTINKIYRIENAKNKIKTLYFIPSNKNMGYDKPFEGCEEIKTNKYLKLIIPGSNYNYTSDYIHPDFPFKKYWFNTFYQINVKIQSNMYFIFEGII